MQQPKREVSAEEGFKILRITAPSLERNELGSSDRPFKIFSALRPGRIVTNNSSVMPEVGNAKLEQGS